MFKGKAFAGAALALMIACLAIPVYASDLDANADADVGGQVTITNVDEDDNTIKLNGSTLKIVNKETNEEFTDVIEYNGVLVYELPLGSYNLIQMTAAPGYELNSKLFEFNLNLPAGTSAETVRMVNAAVMITNKKTESAAETPAEPEPEPEDSSGDPFEPDPEPPVEETSPAEKNPVTADFSIFYVLAAAVFSTALIVAYIAMKRVKNR
jgi:uncharacterized membrane protein